MTLDFTADGHAGTLVQELVAHDEMQVLRPTALLEQVLKRKHFARRSHALPQHVDVRMLDDLASIVEYHWISGWCQ